MSPRVFRDAARDRPEQAALSQRRSIPSWRRVSVRVGAVVTLRYRYCAVDAGGRRGDGAGAVPFVPTPSVYVLIVRFGQHMSPRFT